VAQVHKDTRAVLAVYAGIDQAERSQNSHLRVRNLNIGRLLSDRAKGVGRVLKLSGGFGWAQHPGPATARVPNMLINPGPALQTAWKTSSAETRVEAGRRIEGQPSGHPAKRKKVEEPDQDGFGMAARLLVTFKT
jgi:hypothetical protein